MMSRKTFDIIFSGMTAVAQRVYEVVPIDEMWSQQQVCSELKRQGSNVNFKLVAGCLNTLLKAGLIKEPKPACFRREKIREIADKPPEIPVFTEQVEVELNAKAPPNPASVATITLTPKAAPQATGGKTPLERLAALSDQMAVMSSMLKDVAEQAEALALDVQAEFEKNDQDLEKMRQLQAMMKNFVSP